MKPKRGSKSGVAQKIAKWREVAREDLFALRQYFPKGTDLSSFSQAHLNKIALRLNQRPRQTLGFKLQPIN
jgi:IS30 family transposase